METGASDRPETLEPAAPVNGGMRWRTALDDYHERCRRAGSMPRRAAAPVDGDRRPVPEPGTADGPVISSVAPEEARAGEEYVYAPRAYDGICDGFTWYFEESPSGMRVDRHSGRIAWTPAEGGRFRVTLCARSLYGAVSRQSWTLCVRKPAHVRVAVENRRFSRAVSEKNLRSGQPRRPLWRVSHRHRRIPRAASPPGTPPRASPPAPLLRI